MATTEDSPLRKTFLMLCLVMVSLRPALGADSVAEDSYKRGDYRRAQKQYESEVARSRSQGAQDQPYSALLGQLGNVYYMEGRFSQSADTYRRLVALDEQLYGKDSLRVADDLYSLSRCLRRQLLWMQAQPILLRVLQIRRQQLGECNQDVARSWLDLAVNYRRQRLFPEAEAAYQKAIGIREALPADRPLLRLTMVGYIQMLLEADKMDAAQKQYEHGRSLGLFPAD